MMEFPALRRLDHLIWSLIAAVAAIVLASPSVSNFFIEWKTFAAPVLAAAMLAGMAWFYHRWRPDPRLAAGLESTSQMIAFIAVGAPLSYLAASTNLPLQDHLFDTVDRALGLDWRGMLNWINGLPVVYEAMRPIYLSLTLQIVTALLCLAFTGRLLGLRIFILSFILAALVSIAISALLPAAGVWPYYALTATDSPHLTPVASTSWSVFYGLRDGSFRALTAIGSEGIISFPSLHAALALILIIVIWPIPLLRWLILALNVAMLASTPIEGSHYFSDVLAGLGVAALCLFAARKIAARVEHMNMDSRVRTQWINHVRAAAKRMAERKISARLS